ncbi:MAG: hypothetical protein AAGC64_02775 [Bacteroidota bacterium]
MAMTKTKFKPELIEIDENAIRSAKKKIEDTCEEINRLTKEVETAMGYKLTLEEKKLVVNNKMPGVLKIIRNRLDMMVQKPDTVFDFAGLNPNDINPIFNRYSLRFSYLTGKLEYDKSEFIVPSMVYKEIEKQHTHFTSNQQQNEALKTLKVLADSLEKSIEDGLLLVLHDNFQGKRYALIKNWIKSPLRVKDGRLIPNWQSIKEIKE